jgi:ADP-ribose pyrophosphatase
MPIIVSKKTVYNNQWFTIVAKTLHGSKEPYYAVEQSDCVSVLALTENKKVLLVRQYRPALEQEVLELPSGHIEKGEEPIDAAHRELLEETGYKAENMELIGQLILDTGRLSNKAWCYFASDAVSLNNNILHEEISAIVEYNIDELNQSMTNGTLQQALDLGVILLAMQKGKLLLNNIDER